MSTLLKTQDTKSTASYTISIKDSFLGSSSSIAPSKYQQDYTLWHSIQTFLLPKAPWIKRMRQLKSRMKVLKYARANGNLLIIAFLVIMVDQPLRWRFMARNQVNGTSWVANQLATSSELFRACFGHLIQRNTNYRNFEQTLEI